MSGLALRVTVLDTWDEIPLEVTPETTVTQVKEAALARARVRRGAESYLVKYQGAELADGTTLAGAGVKPNGALIVLSRRRTPVR